MKKFMRMATGLCLVATMAMVSCKKGDNPADKVKGGSGLPKAEAAAKGSEIAFVEVDSLATAYQFCRLPPSNSKRSISRAVSPTRPTSIRRKEPCKTSSCNCKSSRNSWKRRWQRLPMPISKPCATALITS